MPCNLQNLQNLKFCVVVFALELQQCLVEWHVTLGRAASG